jgi:hypothetical protein
VAGRQAQIYLAHQHDWVTLPFSGCLPLCPSSQPLPVTRHRGRFFSKIPLHSHCSAWGPLMALQDKGKGCQIAIPVCSSSHELVKIVLPKTQLGSPNSLLMSFWLFSSYPRTSAFTSLSMLPSALSASLLSLPFLLTCEHGGTVVPLGFQRGAGELLYTFLGVLSWSLWCSRGHY